METQEDEYKHNIWEIYRKEWAIASPEKRIELEKRKLLWQELMKDGLTAQQAYYKAMEEELNFRVAEEPSDKSTSYSFQSWMRKAPLVILGLSLVAAIIFGVITTQDRNALISELESTQSVLISTQSELGSTKQILTTTQSELVSTKQRLDSTQSELGSTKQTLTSTQAELSTTQSELGSTKQILTTTQSELVSAKERLDSTQSSLTSTRNSLTVAQNELEDVEAKLELYRETTGIDDITSNIQPLYQKGGLLDLEASRESSRLVRPTVFLDNVPTATNPTWSKLKEFLLNDPTDDEIYWESMFNCTNFAEMLHNNAEAAGIKCAFVAISFEDSDTGHALNAFKTTDKGLVYVDCIGGDSYLPELPEEWWLYEPLPPLEYDKIAYVMKGKEYGVVSIDEASSPKYKFYEAIGKSSGSGWESLGIVESIEIYW